MSKNETQELQKRMTFNENGEGVINGKTIREIEYESMKIFTENQQKIMSNKIFKNIFKKQHRQKNRKHRQSKLILLLSKNVETIIGIVIVLGFVCAYYLFKTNDESSNASLLSGMLGGLGAIVAILLSISYSKRSNELFLDSSVLPYLIVEKMNELPDFYTAFEYFSNRKQSLSGWRIFDFNRIKEDKRALVRNGIVYLFIKNIGLGPAKKILIEIDNFGLLYLNKDYLLPNESMSIVLNFSNPDKDQSADLIVKYETIRNIPHAQKIPANITWHLDRTNYTLFS